MIDPLSIAVGGVLLAAGYLTGRRTRRRPEADSSKPVCGCGHNLAEHDRATDRCHGLLDRGEIASSKWMDCRCRRYVGPQPIETLWMPPITDTNGESR